MCIICKPKVCKEAKKAPKKLRVDVAFDEPSSATDTQNLRLVARFGARPIDLFNAFTDQGTIQRYTRAEAVVTKVEGDHFSLFGGSILGRITQLDEGRSIEWNWSMAEWGRSVHTRVRITLEAGSEEGETLVTVVQTGVPIHDKYGNPGVIEGAVLGWKERIFTPIKQILGYSYELEDEEVSAGFTGTSAVASNHK